MQPRPPIGVTNDITISSTPYGVLAFLPIIVNVPCSPSIVDEEAEPDSPTRLWHDIRHLYHVRSLHGLGARFDPPTTPRAGIYADLFWSRTNKDGTSYRGLLPLEADEDTHASSSRYPSYHVLGSPLGRVYNILWIPSSNQPNHYQIGKDVFRASWQSILLRHRPPPRRLVGQTLADPYNFLPAIPWQNTLNAPFRFDKAHIQKFMRQSPESLLKVYLPDPNRQKSGPRGRDSDSAVTYAFFSVGNHCIIIQVGRCLSRQMRRPTSAVWARVVHSVSRDDEEVIVRLANDPEHSCSHHHVSQWPGLQKTFRLDTVTMHDLAKYMTLLTKQIVILSFTPCPMNPRTLVLDATYEDLRVQQRNGSM